ncbi:MAG: CRISPR-associated endonuclease Cas3'' [Myxococcales bacterium]|nr:CRISPR-associated endonuclease Cas3'' [Myxococcales bacterium]
MTTLPPGTTRTSDAAVAHLDRDLRVHLLRDHLEQVAALAGQFAARFGASQLAHLAGLWHDLGKYSGGFQRMIWEENGVDAHIEGDTSGPRDHSTAGAIHLHEKLGAIGLLLAFAVAGHHAGMPDRTDLELRLQQEDKRKLYRDVIARADAEILNTAPTKERPPILAGPAGRRFLEMWTRLLFSSLCDADFLDTERFFDDKRSVLRGSTLSIAQLSHALDDHLDRLERKAKDTPVNRVRAEVRAACTESAKQAPGVFALTVPTGGGKTLAGLSFALRHAMHSSLARVIVAIPYTSIIEQTAEVYRRVFSHLGEDAVIEHHCALDPAKENPKNRIASENWDAPIVVTTTVQLLESLFSNRPGGCRKLHRLVGSVIVFDEAQTLPPQLLLPILDGLSTLVEQFGVSIVFSTATQPAFQRGLLLEQNGQLPGFAQIREIVPASLRAFERLRRVEVHWPPSEHPVTWDALAVELAQEPDVLAVVHRRHDARALCLRVDAVTGESETLHLSALMCPAHRSAVLSLIKERKQQERPVRVVATQLVEAGVDLDFAVVYRALAGLDSLAQAAGRCNREGLLTGLGQLRIFRAPTDPPGGVLRSALTITEGLLSQGKRDLGDPALFRLFFQRLYANLTLDGKDIQQMRTEWRFKSVAEAFRMIDDGWSAPLVVRYERKGESDQDAACHSGPSEVDRILRELAVLGPSRDRLRALQRYTVTVNKTDRERWLAGGFVEWIADTVVALKPEYAAAYDERFGLCPDRVGMMCSDFLLA